MTRLIPILVGFGILLCALLLSVLDARAYAPATADLRQPEPRPQITCWIEGGALWCKVRR